MHYRCAHCSTPLEIVDGEVSRCPDHPDGAVEWSPDQAQWQPLGGGDGLS